MERKPYRPWERKRIIAQLFPEEDWMLEKLQTLAEAKKTTIREIVVALVKNEVEQNARVIARIERAKAEYEQAIA